VYVAQSCDSVVALGGGSVLDTGKLVGVLATHGGKADDYLGQSAKVGPRAAPVIAVPTTAGTGSEASSVASIHPVAAARALSVAGPSVAPKVAICDPELTYSLPPGLTAATGMDALSHCIESALAAPEHAIYAALALDGIARVRRFLPVAVRNGADAQARLEMMTAALIGGVVLSRGLGPAHAIAIACGEQGVNHGVLSTIGMIATLDLTGLKAPDRMVPVAAALGIGPGASVARCVEEMARDLRVPTRLGEAGYKMGDIDALARMCAESRFNATSVHHPSAAEYRTMLERVA
jgi:4-hydroxybutyrate dehydrogenase